MFQENRSKLMKQLPTTTTNTTISNAIVVLQGGPSPTRYDTDQEPVFRQESYFWWLTCVKEPDCAVVITPTTCSSTTTTIFIPRLPPNYATRMGRIRTRHE